MLVLDLKSELQRLEAGGTVTGTLTTTSVVPHTANNDEDISMRPQTVDLILQRVQVRTMSHYAICDFLDMRVFSFWHGLFATATAKTSI